MLLLVSYGNLRNHTIYDYLLELDTKYRFQSYMNVDNHLIQELRS